MKRIFSVIIFCFCFVGVQAQNPLTDIDTGSLGIVVNAGIIEPGSDYDDINFSNGVGINIGVLADFFLNNSFNLGLHLGYSETEGQGIPSTWSENYYYKAELIDFSLQLKYKILKYNFAHGKVVKKISPVRPFVFIGFGGAIINNSGYSRYEFEYTNKFTLPKIYAGIALNFHITETLSFGLQTEIQSYLSDAIDGHFGRTKFNTSDDLFSATSIIIGFRPVQ